MSAEVVELPNLVIKFHEYLSCPVCGEFSISPIYTCRKGHIVCGICYDNIKVPKKCPTIPCSATHLTVLEFVEQILKKEGIKIPFRNATFGCPLTTKPSKMKLHLKSVCDYRAIKCRVDGCPNETYRPKDLLKHWLDVHQIPAISVVIGFNELQVKMLSLKRQKLDSTLPSNMLKPMGTVSTQLGMSEMDYKKAIEGTNIYCKVTYFKMDGYTFFVNHYAKKDTFHVWITFLGNESKANEYKYSATVQSAFCKSEPKRKITLEGIPVHSLQYSDVKKAESLGHTVSTSYNSLKMLHDDKPSDSKYILNWEVVMEITKV